MLRKLTRLIRAVEQVPKALELIEDDQVRLQGIDATAGQSLPKLTDDALTFVPVVLPGAQPVRQMFEAFSKAGSPGLGGLGFLTAQLGRERVRERTVDVPVTIADVTRAPTLRSGESYRHRPRPARP